MAAQLDEQELARWLVERGGHATTAVELPGEFSLRGGILDIFAPDADDPVRIELFGDEVESIRRFDVATQRSLETLEATTITMLEPTASDRAHFTSYLPPETWFMLIEPNELQEEGKFYLGADGSAAGVSLGADDARGDLQVSVGDGGGRAGRVDGDDGPPGVRVGRAVQRRDRQGSRRAGQGERRARGVRRLRDGGGGRAAERVVQAQGRQPLWSDSATTVGKRANGNKGTVPARLHFVVGHLEAGFRIVPQRVVLVSAARVVSAAGSGADDAAAAGAGDR